MRTFNYKTSAGGVSKPGDIVGDWVCVRTTRSAPGDGPDWKPVAVQDDAWAGLDAADGVDGRDGADGRDGKDGESIQGPPGESLNPRGAWRKGFQVKRLDCFRHDDATYVATVDGLTKAPPSRGWMLLAKDGADGTDGEAVVYAQRGRPGRDGKDAVAGIPAIFDEATPIGGVVRVSADGHVSLALASGSDAAALAVGFATADVGAGKAGNYVNSGLVSNDEWNWTPGAPLYLSPTEPGEVTETYPTTLGEYVVICGVAVSATEIAVGIQFQNYVGA